MKDTPPRASEASPFRLPTSTEGLHVDVSPPWLIDNRTSPNALLIIDLDNRTILFDSDFYEEGEDPSLPERKHYAQLLVHAPQMFAALKVLTLDPRIRAWLQANDPQALQQALQSLPSDAS